VVVLDNLHRRGSELNLGRFREAGIEFVHGDIREQSDLDSLEGNFDLLIEASAEPSVLAGLNQSPEYLLRTNLVGTLNCLEFARARAGGVVFLSTSRVYSMQPLKALRLETSSTRFTLHAQQEAPGVSRRGIAETFPTQLPRSLYGASKLASEMILQEYADSYGVRAVINRCGVICGPGQFGKVDQGVFALWVIHHFFRRSLQYTGFGGAGKQVRDLLHPDDLFDLLLKQHDKLDEVSGRIFNIGGGDRVSTSLLELTEICRRVTGNSVPIGSKPETSPVDIPLYISDHSLAESTFGWKPRRDLNAIVGDIHRWLVQREADLRPLFAVAA
jgi:CDP-paratose 2-epimerase